MVKIQQNIMIPCSWNLHISYHWRNANQWLSSIGLRDGIWVGIPCVGGNSWGTPDMFHGDFRNFFPIGSSDPRHRYVLSLHVKCLIWTSHVQRTSAKNKKLKNLNCWNRNRHCTHAKCSRNIICIWNAFYVLKCKYF